MYISNKVIGCTLLSIPLLGLYLWVIYNKGILYATIGAVVIIVSTLCIGWGISFITRDDKQ